MFERGIQGISVSFQESLVASRVNSRRFNRIPEAHKVDLKRSRTSQGCFRLPQSRSREFKRVQEVFSGFRGISWSLRMLTFRERGYFRGSQRFIEEFQWALGVFQGISRIFSEVKRDFR